MEIDKEILSKFLLNIIWTLLPKDKQISCGKGKDLWLSDWEIIEVTKCLYIGEEHYLSDPIPRRLEGNSNFNRDNIIECSRFKLAAAQSLEKIDCAGGLLFPNVKRGLDIVLAISIKDWDFIYCYDPNPLYEPLVLDFFKWYGYEDKISFKTKYELLRNF